MKTRHIIEDRGCVYNFVVDHRNVLSIRRTIGDSGIESEVAFDHIPVSAQEKILQTINEQDERVD